MSINFYIKIFNIFDTKTLTFVFDKIYIKSEKIMDKVGFILKCKPYRNAKWV